MTRRNTQLTAIWLGLLVTTLVVAAVSTYVIMHPRATNGEISSNGSWNSVLPTTINAAVNANAVAWGERWYTGLAVTRARVTATRFLGSLAGGKRHGLLDRLLNQRGASSGAALVTWAAGLPDSRVTTSVTDTSLVGDWRNGPARVSARFVVKVHQATRGSQAFTTNLDLRLMPASVPAGSSAPLSIRAGALSAKPPAAWRIDVVHADRRGLRLLTRPVIVPGSVIDVVAESDHASQALAYQAEATAALVEERRKWSKASPSGSIPAITTVYLVASPALANKLLHHGATPEGSGASGWTFENGDVVLLTSALARRPLQEQLGVVRHELTHVANLPLLTTISTLFLEGVATVEETRRSTVGTSRYLDLRPLLRAFNANRLGYDGLLRSRKTAFGETNPDRVALGYLAGYATVSYIDDQFGHDKLQQLLLEMDGGATIDAALNDVLEITPVQLADNTRSWTNVEVHHPPTAPPASSPASTGSLSPGT